MQTHANTLCKLLDSRLSEPTQRVAPSSPDVKTKLTEQRTKLSSLSGRGKPKEKKEAHAERKEEQGNEEDKEEKRLNKDRKSRSRGRF